MENTLQNKCPSCGKPLVAVDYPNCGEVYHEQDTEWGIPPVEYKDTGLLVPVKGALPAKLCKITL